ncbi:MULTISPECIES: MFS transporter [Pseudomonadaceae]|uniref:MFS transporter n=1 Tax=Pseudomonadaceae TaxID=135621 RepID=UPI000CFB46A9|nr:MULTISPECIES: MFS transporter [Pseudomonadaceae]PRB84010.1 MFS transporter [Pseudomonas sp. MYb185]WGK60922.1 MFS transporter [Halopseudomonas sp. SMJS2]
MNKDIANPWVSFIALLFATFVTIEAAAFQAPVLPSVAAHFAIPINLAALILIFYFIAVAVCAPMMGRLGDQYGRRRMISLGLVVFGVAEFMAAWAPSFWFFLLARFLQGLGVACIFPAVFSYVNRLFAEDKRGMALGVMMFVMTFGAASGGLLGGLMIDAFGWQSVYLISGVLALLGLIPLLVWVPESRGAVAEGRFDWFGALLLLSTITALLSLPTWAANFGRDSWVTWTVVVVGVVSLLWLWRHSGRQAAPILDVSLLKDRRFAIPSAIYWIQMLLSSGVVYSLAFFINTRPGGSAAQFGMVTLALYGSTMLASPIAGKLIDRVEPRRVSTLSLFGSLAALILFSQMDTSVPLVSVLLLVGFIGLMLGANSPALMKLALGAVPQHKSGAGSGLFSMLRDLGLPTGSSLALAIFGLSSSFHTRRVAEQTAAELELGEVHAAELLRAATVRGTEMSTELTAALLESGAGVEQVLESITVASLGGAISSVGYLLTGLLVLALALTPFLGRRADVQAVSGVGTAVSR